jgi:hypothetical protein
MARSLLILSRLAAPSEPGSALADSREALGYWSRRASELPWHRRTARREASAKIATARAQLIRAHLQRWRLGGVDAIIGPLLDTGGRSAAAHARSLALTSMRRTPLGRRILVAGATVTALSLTCFGLGTAVAIHLLV